MCCHSAFCLVVDMVANVWKASAAPFGTLILFTCLENFADHQTTTHSTKGHVPNQQSLFPSTFWRRRSFHLPSFPFLLLLLLQLFQLSLLPQTPPPNFPSGPPGDQSVGLLSDPLATIISLAQAHGPVVGLLLGGERVVLVSEPQAAREVLIERADVFVKEGTAFFPGACCREGGLDWWCTDRGLFLLTELCPLIYCYHF